VLSVWSELDELDEVEAAECVSIEVVPPTPQSRVLSTPAPAPPRADLLTPAGEAAENSRSGYQISPAPVKPNKLS